MTLILLSIACFLTGVSGGALLILFIYGDNLFRTK